MISCKGDTLTVSFAKQHLPKNLSDSSGWWTDGGIHLLGTRGCKF